MKKLTMNRKTLLWTLGAGVLAVVSGAATVLLWPSDIAPPDPATAQPEEVVTFLASEQFAQLPEEKKNQYFEQTRQTSQTDPRTMMRAARDLPEKQREQLHRNMRPMFENMFRERIDRYFALPLEQRTAHLDEIIDRMESRRPPRNADRGEENRSDRRRGHWGPRGRRRFSMERHKRMIERIPPEHREKFMRFIKDMRTRRKERGLPEHPFRRRR